jgi:hypothetical protein
MIDLKAARSCLGASDIISLGITLYGEPWLESMSKDIGYSFSQLYRVVYDGAPVTRRMQRELDKLLKRKNRSVVKRRKEAV